MQRRKPSNRPFVIGFVITIVVLSGVTLALIFTKPSIQVNHLPQTVPEYSAAWAKYVPSDALLFGYENYTSVRKFTTYPVFDTLLDFPDLRLRLAGSAMNGVLTIVLETPNASVDFAYLNDQAFSNFTTALAPQSSIAVREGNDSLYYLRNYVNGQFQTGWLALIPADRAIAFSVGSALAQQGIIQCLKVEEGSVPSVLSRLDVRQMLYLVNGTNSHLSIGFQNFPGVVKDGSSTLTAVDASGTAIQVRRIVEFNDSQTTISDWTEVKSAYLNAHQFTIYDSFVEAIETGAVSNVVQYVRLVE